MNCLEIFSNIHWKDAAAIEAAITQKIPELLVSDKAYQHARKQSDLENVRVEGELAIQRAISAILSDYIELFQQFTQNAVFKERLTSFVLAIIAGSQVPVIADPGTEETSYKRRTSHDYPR